MIPPAKRGRRDVREPSRGSARRILLALDRLPVAGLAEAPVAEEHGASLLHAVGVGRTLERIHHALRGTTREREGREASPTAAIIDSQSDNAAQKVLPRSASC